MKKKTSIQKSKNPSARQKPGGASVPASLARQEPRPTVPRRDAKNSAAPSVEKNVPRQPVRAFYHLSRAWYGPANLQHRRDNVVDDVLFGYYYRDGGTDGEMKVEWINLRANEMPSAHISSFYDSWKLLGNLPDLLLAELGKLHGCNISPLEFCDLLKRIGFEDWTPEKQPET